MDSFAKIKQKKKIVIRNGVKKNIEYIPIEFKCHFCEIDHSFTYEKLSDFKVECCSII
jgi:hypothetical protein